jgi:enoyl-CoA hydratase/carnithine racemase
MGKETGLHVTGTDILLESAPSRGVRLLTLRRPQRRNALDVALITDIGAALNRAARDKGIGCVVITGDEIAFCAGADIHEMRAGGLAVLRSAKRARAWRAIERFPKPLLAAVDGVALGSGIELALACDIVIAGRGAKFGHPEVPLGGMPGDGGTQRLPRAIGKSMAMQMILTGVPVDADTAHRHGLVAEVVTAGRATHRAIELAAAIAAHPPAAVAAAKRAVLAAFELPLSRGLAGERRAMVALAATPERNAGLNKFVRRARRREP